MKVSLRLLGFLGALVIAATTGPWWAIVIVLLAGALIGVSVAFFEHLYHSHVTRDL